MKNRILLITHENVGQSLLKIAKHTFGYLPMPIKVIAVDYHESPETVIQDLKKIAENLSPDEDLLILTDMYGSTPCNIALALQQHPHLQVVSGLNLPMLIKILNYPNMPFHKLAQKAIQGGREGIVNCTREYRKLLKEMS